MNVEREPHAATPEAATIGIEAPEISAVGVIGTGQMGNGIAHVAALAGFKVTMLDVKPEAIEKA
ncbi:MAG: 3-hydroxyacyl-CoA dehydrogenase NAD-binding domain-containing protein, partial [Acetobacteraceae bacterium]